MRFEAFIHFDPSAWYLPKNAYEKGIEKVKPHIGKIANGLKNMSRNGTRGKWGERIEQNKEYYDWMKQVVDRFKAYLTELEEDKI